MQPLDTERFCLNTAVRTYEVGADGLLKPETALHWFQEAAEAHASTLNLGYDFVVSHGLAWVESKLDMAFLRRPAWKEVVTLSTWTAQATPLLARRNVEVRDESGAVIINASCLWAIIDIQRRRPVPLQKAIPSLPHVDCEVCVPSASLSQGDLAGLDPLLRSWTAGRRDTDFNNHINNAAYLIWAMESLPDSWLKSHTLDTLHLHFKRECHEGENIVSQSFLKEPHSYHRICRQDDLLAEVVLEWI